jgi:hypothetical protein
MSILHIAELIRRYRLPPSRAGEAGRLDRVLERALHEGLEPALARLGVDPAGEVCVREVRVPVRLRLSRGDGDLALAWVLALAAGVRDALASGRDGAAVRYASRRQALVDFAAGVARGDLTRAWAWRQLGLSPVWSHPSRAEAARALAAALQAEPEAVVAVVAAVARLGHLPALLAALGPEAVAVLARAAAGAGGAPLLDAAEDGEVEGAGAGGPRQNRILERSEILREAAEAVRAWPPGARRAVALLGLLEVEPALVRGGARGAPSLLAAAARGLGGEEAPATRGAATPSPQPPPGREREAGAGPPSAPFPLVGEGWGGGAGAEREGGREGRSGQGPPLSPWAGGRAEGEELGAEAPIAPAPVPDLGAAGATDWGGLLFLLGLLEDLGFPQEALGGEAVAAAASAAGAGRPLRWVMHALAQTLAPLAPHDPAALAFAGLAPDRTPPSLEEPGSTQAERGVLEGWRDRVAAALEDRLPGAGRRGPALVRWVCRRRATVVADSGWLELRLPSKEVSTELRRAGLDLDPGWIPWLGVVVVFRYGGMGEAQS